jgi:hypothetical protein
MTYPGRIAHKIIHLSRTRSMHYWRFAKLLPSCIAFNRGLYFSFIARAFNLLSIPHLNKKV